MKLLTQENYDNCAFYQNREYIGTDPLFIIVCPKKLVNYYTGVFFTQKDAEDYNNTLKYKGIVTAINNIYNAETIAKETIREWKQFLKMKRDSHVKYGRG